MANPVTFQKSMGKYLWHCLLSLGFQPEAETSHLVGKKTIKFISLGIHMFDKPNKDAFYIVTHFLLDKLDPTLFNEAYRHCWPVYDRNADTEFRKITFAWLKDIVDENSTSAPKVLASLFLSPGGPKFIALMLHLAKHVMLQEMKTFATDGRWTPEGAAMPTSTLDIAMKRFKLTKTRFLKSSVGQDHLLQEYQRRAQNLVRSIREIGSEGAKYDNLLKRQENDLYKEWDASAQKLQRVRSLWLAIDEMLSTLKEDQQGLACVLKADSDQYVLDGANLALKIPRVLLEKIEQLPQQLSSGNVYEAGQLNPLCLLELMNHALQLLQEERVRVAGLAPLAHLRPQELQAKSGQAARVLEELKVLRQKISKEAIPEVRNASRKLDMEWDRRWRDTLNDKPLASFLMDDPALCFLSPMAPLCFEPAAEATWRSGVFSCYAAKLPGEFTDEEEPAQFDSQAEFDGSSPKLNRSPVCPVPLGRSESPPATASFSASSPLADLLHTLSSPPRGPSPSPPPTIRQASDKTTHTSCKVAPTKNKAKILDRESDNLASQFAEAITTTSPLGGKMRGLALDDLLCNLGGDPFSTRKQLHRTPESLIADVKSSWRKAVEECKVQTTNQSPTSDGDCSTTRLTPRHDSPTRPLTFSFNTTPIAATACPSITPQQHLWTSLGSPPDWGFPDTEGRHSVSAKGSSSAVHFSLDDETLPDMAGSDSLLSLSDENPDDYDGSGGDLLPLSPFSAGPKTGWPTPLLDLDDKASFLGMATPGCSSTRPAVPGSAGGWLEADGVVPPDSDALFLLDLEALDTLTPSRQYTLPKLITFSPMDDL